MDIKFKDNSKLELVPYTQLEYIESTGTQYIDTGISAPNGFKVDVTYQYSEIESGYKMIIGSINSGNPYCRNMVGKAGSGGDIFFIGNKSGDYGLASISYNKTKLIASTVDATSINVDGENYATTKIARYSDSVQSSYNLFIFGCNSGGNLDQSVKIKLFSLDIYDYQNNKVRAFIPVLDFNEVACLYDTISKTFFYNQGTGNFISGPPVKSILPENILLKITTLYHKNTPNIDGLQLLNSILNAQETADDVVLNRIRLDIGNVSGSLSDLLQYASMAGFNDNYEPQVKPRLVGTWTINSYYTPAQLAQAQAAFDGLTIVGDPNYVLDFSQMAVQVLDPNEDNYNPAVAIILQGQNLGTTMTNSPLGYGRWFITKTQATNISTISNWFRTIATVTDTNGIVSTNTSQTYDFDNFDCFKLFTGVTKVGSTTAYEGFKHCTNLTSIILPSSIIEISTDAFSECHNLASITILSTAYSLTGSNQFNECSSLTSLDLSKTTNDLTLNNTFRYCYKLKNLLLNNDKVKSIQGYGFFGVGEYAIFNNNDEFIIDFPNLTSLTGFNGSKIITEIRNLGNITSLPNSMIANCSRLTFCEINSIVTAVGKGFDDANGTCIVHMLPTQPPTLYDIVYYLDVGKVYVGEGISASDDNNTLQNYLADSKWGYYSSKLDTWYNYIHPTS